MSARRVASTSNGCAGALTRPVYGLAVHAPPVELDLDALFQPGRAQHERLAAHAGGRGRRDGRDEPSSRDARGPSRARAGRERRRRRPRSRGRPDRRRADGQRGRRRRLRSRLGRTARCTASTARAGRRPTWAARRLDRRAGRGRSPCPARCGSGPTSRSVSARSGSTPRSGRQRILRAAGVACSAAHRRQVGCGPLTHRWPAPATRRDATGCPSSQARLRRIAAEGPDACYEGEVAAAIAAATWLSEDDLARPPLGVGRAAAPLVTAASRSASCRRTGRASRRLLALALYEGLEPGVHSEVEAMKLAFADARAVVHDGPAAGRPLRGSAPRSPAGARPPRCRARRLARRCQPGGTTYLCAVDGDGMAVSLIQSLYGSFGSGVVAPGDGDRAAEPRPGFSERAGPPERARSPQAAVPHDHPGDAARGRRAARAVRRHGRADAAAGPLPGRPADRRRRRRPAGGARRAALARRGARAVRARARPGSDLSTICAREVTTSRSATGPHGSASAR